MVSNIIYSDFKRHLQSLLRDKKQYRIEEEYIVGDFRADIVVVDTSGIPAIIFEVKDKYSPVKKDDIRTWAVEFRDDGKSHAIPVLLAYCEQDVWHFRNADDKEVDLMEELQMQLDYRKHTKISYWPFHLVSTGICLFAIVGLFSPLFCLNIAPMSKEIVILFCAAGICFLLPYILPFIKEVNWKGGYVTFVHIAQRNDLR